MKAFLYIVIKWKWDLNQNFKIQMLLNSITWLFYQICAVTAQEGLLGTSVPSIKKYTLQPLKGRLASHSNIKIKCVYYAGIT